MKTYRISAIAPLLFLMLVQGCSGNIGADVLVVGGGTAGVPAAIEAAAALAVIHKTTPAEVSLEELRDTLASHGSIRVTLP